ncbi:hypothetical protein CXB51_000392 [Gossypium anomalum]|uniref:Integrase catalytic domain-containing protein n=1 Tax=Gossypium anomalum TaxID=47600 RepID=A0A8J6D8L5_9ROSI|nr:hypothetical protein CXB51_000392 [Gossypium anomalum]
MATDAVPADDTPRHSSNTREAVHSQGLSSGTPTVHYFAKHDTIKLAAYNFLLWKHQILLILEGYELEGFVLGTVAVPPAFLADSDGQIVENLVFLAYKKQDKFLASWLLSTVTNEVLVHLTTAKTSFDVWTTIERRFGTTSTLKISSMRHALYSIKKSNLTITEYVSKVKTLCDNLTAVGSLVTEAEQVSVILAGLSVEYESVCVFASASPISLDMLTDMLLDCEARQLVLLTEVPIQANLATRSFDHVDGSKFSQSQETKHWHKKLGQGWSRGRSRGGGRSWSRSRPQCQLYGKFSSTSPCSSAHCCSSFSPSTAVSHPVPPRASTSFTSDQLWYPDYGTTNHITPEASNLTSASPYTGTSHVTMGNGESIPITNVRLSTLLASSKLLRLQNVLHILFDIQTGTTLLEGYMHEGLYRFQFSKTSSTKIPPSAQTFYPPLLNNTQISSSSLWHNRLHHPCNNTLACNSLPRICTTCQLGKAHKLLFGSSHTIYSSPFELVVTDVWGPAHVSSNGFTYYVLFVDMFSRYTWSIKMLQTDWGGEYHVLSKTLSSLGIQHRVTCPYTSEQNGVAERKHRQIVDMGLSLLAQSAMPLQFWYYAFTHALYLTNRLPTPILSQVSPYETLHKLQPDYGPSTSTSYSFGPNSVFLGVAPNRKGYWCLAPDGWVYFSRHVRFDEAKFPFHDGGFCSPSQMVPPRPLHQQSVLLVVVPGVSSSSTVTRSARDSPEVPFCAQSLHSHPCSSSRSSDALTVAAPAPTDLVSLPDGQRTVGCKWIFKIKRHADGSIARYKGRLVVKGYLQEADIDFQETFSPVVKPTTVRVVLALAVSLNWPLRQVDINNAFLNGDLSEEIYIVQPPGFEQQGLNGERLVCKLRKALYGLKQAPRVWFHKLKDFLVDEGFEVSKADNSLFILRSGSQLLYVLVYVDDIIITGNESRAIDRFVA